MYAEIDSEYNMVLVAPYQNTDGLAALFLTWVASHNLSRVAECKCFFPLNAFGICFILDCLSFAKHSIWRGQVSMRATGCSFRISIRFFDIFHLGVCFQYDNMFVLAVVSGFKEY